MSPASAATHPTCKHRMAQVAGALPLTGETLAKFLAAGLSLALVVGVQEVNQRMRFPLLLFFK